MDCNARQRLVIKRPKIGVGPFVERQVCDVKVQRRAVEPIKRRVVDNMAVPDADDQIACAVLKLVCGMVNLTSMVNF